MTNNIHITNSVPTNHVGPVKVFITAMWGPDEGPTLLNAVASSIEEAMRWIDNTDPTPWPEGVAVLSA